MATRKGEAMNIGTRILSRALVMLGALLMATMFWLSGYLFAPLAAAIGGPILVLVVWIWCGLGAVSYLVMACGAPLGPRLRITPELLTSCGGGVVSHLLLRRLGLFDPPR